MTHIAFIGLGNMGRPMAANLVRAGYDVRGFDLVPLLRDNAAEEGVSIAASTNEALEGADVVITMLPGGKHVLSVWADLLPHAHEGMLFIDSSTTDVDSARRAHELAGSAGVLRSPRALARSPTFGRGREVGIVTIAKNRQFLSRFGSAMIGDERPKALIFKHAG